VSETVLDNIAERITEACLVIFLLNLSPLRAIALKQPAMQQSTKEER
jgi:hypothetical protein